MQLIRDLETVPDDLRGGALSIGNFDGVHRGHARLIERLVATARRLGGPAVVFTFDPSPTKILRPSAAPETLSWIERRAALLGRLGVDFVIAYPTDRRLLQLTPEQFFAFIVVDRLRARAMVEGDNFHFGRGRAGNIDRLADLCRGCDVELGVVGAIELFGEPVSSSRIRRLIAAGDVELAARLLVEPYRIRGTVAPGARRGAALGFPTANLAAVDTLLPGEGIYAGHAHPGEQRHAAAISIGPNPTFGESSRKMEVYLLDFDGDLYDRPLQVDFLARLRDIIRFECVEDLTAQMRCDIRRVRQLSATSG